MNKKIHGVPVLVVLVIISVYSAGCMGSSAMVHNDPFQDRTPGTFEKELPPLLNYPLPGQVQADDGVPGIYLSGDILQPPNGSPLYDPDIAVMVIRDTGDGRYEIGGIVNSGGTWYRLPGSIPGPVDHLYIERTFSVITGKGDYNSLAILDDWRPDGSNRA
jgi:hypothetical protein